MPMTKTRWVVAESRDQKPNSTERSFILPECRVVNLKLDFAILIFMTHDNSHHLAAIEGFLSILFKATHALLGKTALKPHLSGRIYFFGLVGGRVLSKTLLGRRDHLVCEHIVVAV